MGSINGGLYIAPNKGNQGTSTNYFTASSTQTESSVELWIYGNLYIMSGTVTGTVATAASDKTIKKNIRVLGSSGSSGGCDEDDSQYHNSKATSMLNSIRGVTYQYNEKY